MKAVGAGLGGKVAGQKIDIGEDEIERVHQTAAGLQPQGDVDDEDGEDQVDGVFAIVKVGDRQAGQNEIKTFEVDVGFDEKYLVNQTDRVG